MVFVPSTTGLQPSPAALSTLQTAQWAIAAGTSDAITAAYPTPNTALTDGLILGFRASTGNTTTTPTFAPDGLGPAVITKEGGVAVTQGDIPKTGAECFVRYNLASNRWELMNPVNDGGAIWAVAGGTAQAITAAYTPPNLSLQDGLILAFRASLANTAAAPTFAPDGLTAQAITKYGGQPLLPGDIAGNLAEHLVRYNLVSTRWELLNPGVTQDRWIAAGGSAQVITAAYAPAVVGVVDGLTLQFRALATNTAAAPTFSPNGLTARAITKVGGAPLSPGDIAILQECTIVFNLANTRWELQNPAQVQNVDWAIVAGTDTLTASYLPVNVALYDGLRLRFRGANSNATTTPTFSPDGLTAHTIVKRGATALAVGDIVTNGEYTVTYNLANTRWVLLNPTVP